MIMKNKKIISPIGLKGNEIHERQLALMGIKPINENENKGNHAVELTKMGPDGNAYAIIRENHEYYIKISAKTNALVLEDFKYIGGLQNKKSEAYPSYAKAIKQLNLKFKSLAEAYNRGGDINVFEDDNLLSEHHPLKADMKLSATKGIGDNQEYVVNKKGKELSYDAKEGKEKGQFGDNLADGKACDDCEEVKVNESFGMGFSGEGNLEGNRPMMEDKKKNNPWAICRGQQNKVGKDKMSDAEVESCVLKKKQEFKMDESITENAWMEECGSGYMEEVEMTEYERAIDEMMSRYDEEELHGGQHKIAALAGDPKKIGADDLEKVRAGALSEYSIEEALRSIDEIFDSLTEGTLKKKVLTKKK